VASISFGAVGWWSNVGRFGLGGLEAGVVPAELAGELANELVGVEFSDFEA